MHFNIRSCYRKEHRVENSRTADARTCLIQSVTVTYRQCASSL